jgi:hypothetical protein
VNTPGSLRIHSFDLGDQDRARLDRIKKRLQLKSTALAIRLAIRDLAERLVDPGESDVAPAAASEVSTLPIQPPEPSPFPRHAGAEKVGKVEFFRDLPKPKAVFTLDCEDNQIVHQIGGK